MVLLPFFAPTRRSSTPDVVAHDASVRPCEPSYRHNAVRRRRRLRPPAAAFLLFLCDQVQARTAAFFPRLFVRLRVCSQARDRMGLAYEVSMRRGVFIRYFFAVESPADLAQRLSA